MIANALVPIANPPRAGANRPSLATRGGSRRAADDAGAATVEGAVELMVRIVHCSTHQDDEAPPTAHGTLWCARMRTRGWSGSCRRGQGCFASASASASTASGRTVSSRLTSSLPGPSPGIMCAERSNQTRSAEHTSELQPLMRNSYAVFCLKKKTIKKNKKNKYTT